MLITLFDLICIGNRTENHKAHKIACTMLQWLAYMCAPYSGLKAKNNGSEM